MYKTNNRKQLTAQQIKNKRIEALAEQQIATQIKNKLKKSKIKIIREVILTDIGLSFKQFLFALVISFFAFILFISVFTFTQPIITIFLSLGLAVFLSVIIKVIYKNKYENEFTSEFEVFLNVLIVSLKTGTPIIRAIRNIVQDQNTILALEFAKVIARVDAGLSVTKALEILITRINNSETIFFYVTISIQQDTGGSIVNALNNLSDVMLERKKLNDKIKASTAEARFLGFAVMASPIVAVGAKLIGDPEYYTPILNADGSMSLTMMIIIGWYLLGCIMVFKLVSIKV